MTSGFESPKYPVPIHKKKGFRVVFRPVLRFKIAFVDALKGFKQSENWETYQIK